MRIIYWVCGGIVVMLIAILVGMSGWEKGVLMVAGYQLKQDVIQVRQLARKGTRTKDCKSWLGYQLRFISDQEYVLEPACGFKMDDSGVGAKKLFGGVKRLYGPGVLVTNTGDDRDEDAWVHLVFGESKLVVGIINGESGVSWEADKFSIGGKSPASAACNNWGFSCCQEDREVGEGDQVITHDCISSCFQRCNQKPAVIRFNSRPLMNPETRTVIINRNDQEVGFGFDISDEGELSRVEIDYGDGESDTGLAGKTQDLVHKYNCRGARCEYLVKLQAWDSNDNQLTKSNLNTIRIMVE